MQSITTQYLGAGYSRGSRIKATSSSGKSVTSSYRPELTNEENHDRTAMELCQKLGWANPFFQLVRGGRERAGKEIGNVYVIFDLSAVVTLADVNATAREKGLREV